MKYGVLVECKDYIIFLGFHESFGSAMQNAIEYLEGNQCDNGRYDNVHFTYGLECNDTGCSIEYTLHGDNVCEEGITETLYILEYGNTRIRSGKTS